MVRERKSVVRDRPPGKTDILRDEWSAWAPVDKEHVLWFKVNLRTGNVKWKCDTEAYTEKYVPETGERRPVEPVPE